MAKGSTTGSRIFSLETYPYQICKLIKAGFDGIFPGDKSSGRRRSPLTSFRCRLLKLPLYCVC